MAQINHENTIRKGYQLNTSVDIRENMLVLNPILEGVGETTWLLETPSNELVILVFSWGVLPNEVPTLSKKYKIYEGKVSQVFVANLECTFHYREKDFTIQWTNLNGLIDENIQIDIKRELPIWTSPKNAKFINLLGKHRLKIRIEE